MANITITSTDAALTINYGQYDRFIGVKSEKMNRNNVALSLSEDGTFIELTMSKWALLLSHDGHGNTYQVDSINAEPIASTEDLYDKLAALIG